MRLAARGVSGSLHQFTQKVTNKSGEIVEYPKVKGTRNANNLKHWRWQISWKEKIDGKWRTRCRKIRANKVATVKQQLLKGEDIHRILESL
jgi:hypothetical protein